MNKVMIVAILVAYKAFNDKSLTLRVNEGEGKYVVNKAIIERINDNTISVVAFTYSGVYGKTIDIDNIVGIQFQK